MESILFFNLKKMYIREGTFLLLFNIFITSIKSYFLFNVKASLMKLFYSKHIHIQFVEYFDIQ